MAESRKNAVCGEGDLYAHVMFIAQAPEENEDREGIMFIGPSGMVLNEMLNRIEIKRKDIYLTNLVKCNLLKNRKPKSDEIETCTRFLEREIEVVRPGILVPLGYYATKYIFEKYGIASLSKSEFHRVYGNIFMADHQEIFPIQHPATVLHNPAIREEMIKNYNNLKTFCKKQGIPLDRAMAELRKAGFKLNNTDNTLEEIADSKGTSGMGVYEMIKKLEPKPEAMKPGGTWTSANIEESFAGTGVGRKNIGQIIKDHQLDHKTAHQRLKEKRIMARDDDKIKELADRYDTTPMKILTIILVKKK